MSVIPLRSAADSLQMCREMWPSYIPFAVVIASSHLWLVSISDRSDDRHSL